MARTGLTWKLKLDDAMSGAAQKIATKLGQVKGALNGLDEAKVTGPTAATTNAEQVAAKIADDRAARVQKAMQAESAASAKFTEQESARAYRAADQIATAQEKGQERVQAARDRIRAAEEKYAAGSSRMTAKQAERQKAAIVKAKSELQTEITKIERETQDKVDVIRTKAQRASADATSKFEARQQRSRERSQVIEERRSAAESTRARKVIEREERKLQRSRERSAKPKKKGGDGGGFGGIMAGVGGFIVAAEAAIDVIARIGSAIASVVGPLISRSMELQKFAQSTKYAFGQLLGSGGAADEAWNRAQEIAVKTGLSLQEVAGSMNALMAQGMGIDEVTELTKRFADLRAINPAANIEGIARAMMQIKATGRLQGDELMQLNEAGMSADKIYGQLEKRLGKTRAEVLKLQEAGKISSEDAIAAIKGALAEKTGAQAGKFAEEAAQKTLGGAIGRLQAQIDKLLAADSPAFAALARSINMIVDAISSGKAAPMINALSKVMQAAAGFAEKLTKAVVGGEAQGVMDQLVGAILKVAAVIDSFSPQDIAQGLRDMADTMSAAAAIAKVLWLFIKPLMDISMGLFMAIVKVTNAIDGWIGSFDAAGSATGSLGDKVNELVGKLTGGLTGAFTSSGSALGTSFVSGIVEAISNGASAMAEAARSAASSAVDAAMDAIGDIEFPSFGGTVPGGGMMGDSMMMGAAAGRDMRSGDTNRTFSPTVNVNVSGGASNTGGMVSAIGDALKSLNNSFA